ncbi:hypothetical protein GGF31_006253 [Allomyces arbusculus]|nr:hypothetical protein GGF31_006253 [Allomyces arbusculus]
MQVCLEHVLQNFGHDFCFKVDKFWEILTIFKMLLVFILDNQTKVDTWLTLAIMLHCLRHATSMTNPCMMYGYHLMTILPIIKEVCPM